MINKIKELQSLFCVAGYENKVTEFIINRVKDYCDESYIDKLGNAIIHKKGKGDKLLLSVPISSNGLFVTHITDDFKGKFKAIGDLKASKITGMPAVNEKNEIVGIVYPEKSDSSDVDDMYIDFGAYKKEDVKVSVGDVLAISEDAVKIGENIYGNNAAKWANIFVISEIIKEIKSEYDLYFAFTVMDNIGFKGAKTSAFSINPDLCITLSVSYTDEEESNVKLSSGPVLRIKDSHIIVNKNMRDSLIKKAGDIPYQLEILSKEGLSSNEIMYLGNGILTANINIPATGKNECKEAINIKDVENYKKYILKILNQE